MLHLSPQEILYKISTELLQVSRQLSSSEQLTNANPSSTGLGTCSRCRKLSINAMTTLKTTKIVIAVVMAMMMVVIPVATVLVMVIFDVCSRNSNSYHIHSSNE